MKRIVLALTLVAALIGGATFATGGKLIPSAYACCPSSATVVQNTTVYDLGNSTTTLSATLPNNVAAGNRVVVLLGWGGGNDFSVSGLTQTQGSDLSPIVSQTDGLNDGGAIYDAAIASSGSETVSLTLSENNCPCQSVWVQSTMTVVEITGANPSDGHGGAADNGSGGTYHVVGGLRDHPAGVSFCANGCGNLALGFYVDAGENTGIYPRPTNEGLFATEHDNTVSIQWEGGRSAGLTDFEFDTVNNAPYAVVVAASWPTNNPNP